jgi:hypothetical protein
LSVSSGRSCEEHEKQVEGPASQGSARCADSNNQVEASQDTHAVTGSDQGSIKLGSR